MLEVVNPTYSKFENEMYTVTCHYSPHVIISKESLDFFLLKKNNLVLERVVDHLPLMAYGSKLSLKA